MRPSFQRMKHGFRMMGGNMDQFTPTKPLDRYLSKLDVWGMAFGCMVGWGVFAMPGNTFLPVAGPAGTVIAMAIGMVIMLIIAGNFSYLMVPSSVPGSCACPI